MSGMSIMEAPLIVSIKISFYCNKFKCLHFFHQEKAIKPCCVERDVAHKEHSDLPRFSVCVIKCLRNVVFHSHTCINTEFNLINNMRQFCLVVFLPLVTLL